MTFTRVRVATTMSTSMRQLETSRVDMIVLTFCVVGSYALSNRMFDVWVTSGQ